jgi:hypothetical protein
MRKPLSGLVFILCVGLALPALAQGVYEEDSGGGEESALAAYGSNVGNRFLMGVNGLITFPADPAMGTVRPREEFEELPLAFATKRVVGLLQGTLLGAYRLGTAPLDMLFAPLTPMRMLSPAPRYMLFPNVEHEWY